MKKKKAEVTDEIVPSTENATVTKTITEYPSWTTPEHLNVSEHESLKKLYDLLVEEKFDLANEMASNFDTVIKEEIPRFVWSRLQGIPNDESSNENMVVLSEESQEPTKRVVSKATEISFPNALIVKNDVFEPITNDEVMKLLERKFQSKQELEELVIKNNKSFFGQQTLVFHNKEETGLLFPDYCLFDLSDIERPRMCLIVFALVSDDFGTIYARITHFIASLKGNHRQSELLGTLCDIIEYDYERNSELQLLTNDRELLYFLSETIENKPEILLIMDGRKNDVQLMQETYTDTWGRIVKPVIIKKYNNDDSTMYTISPLVTAINTVEKKKKKAEVVNFTEEDHLQAVSETVKSVYLEIKTALLNVDDSIAFNPKKYYISLRKNKNIAFFQFRKKVLSIVVCNSEEETRAIITQHEIKSLVQSVQKFWNAECCTIIIDRLENLDEVISLLQMMITKS